MEANCLLRRENLAVIALLGGDVPADRKILEAVSRAEYCVCADSGAEIARTAGRVPDLLVGDMDSVAAETYEWCRNVGVAEEKYHPEKDYTDGEFALERALEYALEHGVGSVAVVGGVGDRLDHTMANIYRGKRIADRGIAVSYLNDEVFVYVLSGECERQVALADGKTVSLLPLGMEAEGITLRGFQYPLENAAMSIDGDIYGISNELVAELGKVSLKKGCLVVIQWRKVV